MRRLGRLLQRLRQTRTQRLGGQALLEALQVDDGPAMQAFTDQAGCVTASDLEGQCLALDLDQLDAGLDLHAHRRGRDMAHFHMGAHRALALVEVGPQGLDAGLLHEADHHGGREHRGHV